ncbi:MAG: hypothetical protein V2I36_00525 [Desulfopila sp.]|nr:hypothetical protein [Desulfopila sp.]
MPYTCRNCGAKADKEHEVCSGTPEEPEANFCGIPEEWICESKLPTMQYTCETCGSVSVSPDTLCKPEKIKSSLP